MAAMIHFISDTFFGRSSKAKSRKFSSVEEMNLEMVNRWNGRVKPNDAVYHLGNFAWDIITAEQILENLNGTINLIPSVYDSAVLAIADNFYDLSIIENSVHCIETRNLVLCPWRMAEWPGKGGGSLHLHGGEVDELADLDKENRFNINCEIWSLSPISLDSIENIVNLVNENKK